jgi:hypothetical protein
MRKINVYVLSNVQQIISARTHIFAGTAVGSVGAVTLMFLKTVIATVGLFFIVCVRLGPLKIDRRGWRRLALLGFVRICFGQPHDPDRGYRVDSVHHLGQTDDLEVWSLEDDSEDDALSDSLLFSARRRECELVSH